jgi:hypothetical protein
MTMLVTCGLSPAKPAILGGVCLRLDDYVVDVVVGRKGRIRKLKGSLTIRQVMCRKDKWRLGWLVGVEDGEIVLEAEMCSLRSASAAQKASQSLGGCNVTFSPPTTVKSMATAQLVLNHVG